MVTVSMLKALCEKLEKQFGPDIPVYIQIRDDEGRLIERDSCKNAFNKIDDGTLILSNRKPIPRLRVLNDRSDDNAK